MECVEGIGLFIGGIKFSQRHTGSPEVCPLASENLKARGHSNIGKPRYKALAEGDGGTLAGRGEGAGSESGLGTTADQGA
jgi:hypothetical protein